MIIYRAIPTDDGHWTVGWYVNGVWQGFVWGCWHTTDIGARSAIEGLSNMEGLETGRPRRPSTGKPRQQGRERRFPEA